MADEQRRQTGPQAQLQAVGVRLGGLLVLMLTVGRWVDVLHILLCFLGEAGCLLLSRDLLDAALQVSLSPPCLFVCTHPCTCVLFVFSVALHWPFLLSL